jgi:hypothetical protein
MQNSLKHIPKLGLGFVSAMFKVLVDGTSSSKAQTSEAKNNGLSFAPMSDELLRGEEYPSFDYCIVVCTPTSAQFLIARLTDKLQPWSAPLSVATGIVGT